MSILLERMREISDCILAADLVYGNEYDLQAGIHAVLEQAGYYAQQEIVLSDGSPNRIDIFVNQGWLEPGIGIEVKIDSPRSEVLRQLTRYAGELSIAGLILVTTRSKHHRLPLELNNKPLRLVSLVGAGL